MKRLFEIDKLMAKSLTKQICDGYRTAIADGRLGGGVRFPTCREICDEFDVSMIVAAAVGRLGSLGFRSRSDIARNSAVDNAAASSQNRTPRFPSGTHSAHSARNDSQSATRRSRFCLAFTASPPFCRMDAV